MGKFNNIEIKAVRNKKQMDAFIRMAWPIYRKDPNWIPPLVLERKMHLSRRNPYFSHAQVRFWLAVKGRRVVGRISAQIDRLYLERYSNSTGFWGMLEAENDIQIFRALMETAESWLKKKGMKRIQGPFNLSINQECGLLIKGFEYAPAVMMGHALPYYADIIRELGHEKAKDLIAYSIKKEDNVLEKIRKILGSENDHFQTRPLNRKKLEKELDTIFSIFNDAWSNNWGFVPFTRQEYMDVGKSLSFLAKDEFIRIAEMDGEPAGFITLLPNLNEIIEDLDGRLIPWGWLRLLWRIKFHKFTSGRVLLMGVRKKHQESLAGAAISLCLIRDIMKEVMKTSISELELSWILEDNLAMRRIIEALGAEPYKTYRIYEKRLS